MIRTKRESASLPVDHPGTFIAEELEARGLTQADLAYILGIDAAQLNRLIKGATDITPDMAVALSDAFDVPAEFFMNLQKMYDLPRAKKADPGVRTRASWVSVFPIREMIRRGWIEDAEAGLLDLQMLRFFDKNRVEDIPFINGDIPVVAHAAKKTGYENLTPIQYVWLSRVRKIAENIRDCPPYSHNALRESLSRMRAHMLDRPDIARVPEMLWQAGVPVVLVEALPGSKIDGVCVWLNDQPIIALTLRWDRFDNFCFVVRHEIEHVLKEDGREESFSPIDELSNSSGNPNAELECEMRANEAAAEFCVPQDMLRSFLLRKAPFISERDMLAFAARVNINPAVVVGQIQKQTDNYTWLKRYQASVRSYLMNWRFVDGWGHQVATGL